MFVNTTLAAAAGVLAALVVSRPILGRMDIFAGLNGAIAGLVSITAGPDIAHHYWAIVIGAIGGGLCVGGIKLLERFRIDDVVGAVPAHLICGIWGTLAVPIASDVNFFDQLIGVVAVGAFVFGASGVVWLALDRVLSARVSRQVEELGQDVGELGIEAYPEFVLMPEPFTDDED